MATENNTLSPFHLAFPTADLEATRAFFTDVLGCRVGRTSERWVDFDFSGHQITAHRVEQAVVAARNPVDGHEVPTFHFGLVLPRAEWHALKERLEAAGIEFLIPPSIRFMGQPGEQATLFIREPGGNVIEFKSMPLDRLFTPQ